MGKNAVKSSQKTASTAGKTLRKSEGSKILKKLAGSTLVNAKRKTKNKEK